ncbi:MAG TPA: NrdR family transcriptional regulator [Candidatus Brocadiaceae bacterium]
MQCRNCKYPDSRVVETTKDDRCNQIYRRRECVKCGVRFTTQENLRSTGYGPNYTTPAPRRILEK